MPFWISNRCGALPAPACRSSLSREVFRSFATRRRWAPSVSPGVQQIKKTSNAPKPVPKLWVALARCGDRLADLDQEAAGERAASAASSSARPIGRVLDDVLDDVRDQVVVAVGPHRRDR